MNKQTKPIPRVFFRQWITREQLEQMYPCPHTEQDPSETAYLKAYPGEVHSQRMLDATNAAILELGSSQSELKP